VRIRGGISWPFHVDTLRRRPADISLRLAKASGQAAATWIRSSRTGLDVTHGDEDGDIYPGGFTLDQNDVYHAALGMANEIDLAN
jgi:hypothetical protein